MDIYYVWLSCSYSVAAGKKYKQALIREAGNTCNSEEMVKLNTLGI